MCCRTWTTFSQDKATKGAACCRRRIELVQDLEFPEACHRIKATSDGKFLFATGIHPPRLRCYELSELSMKFERHFDSEVVDFQVRVGGSQTSASVKERDPHKVADPACLVQQVPVVPLPLHHAADSVYLFPNAAAAHPPRQSPAWLQILSEDYSKAVFLCRDRSLQFHAKFGAYHSTRIPRFGRDMAYAPFNADLLIVGSAPEVYRCGQTPACTMQEMDQ